MQDNKQAVIRLNGIAYRYAQGESLQFKDLEVTSGQHTLILGDSGSGKTTLLHILSGLLKPETGSVRIDGQSIYDLPARKLDEFRGQRIGLISQEAHLGKNRTRKANVQIAQGFDGAKIERNRTHEGVN